MKKEINKDKTDIIALLLNSRKDSHNKKGNNRNRSFPYVARSGLEPETSGL